MAGLGDVETIIAPLLAVGEARNTLDITATVNGGGTTGQTDAVMMGVARALLLMKPDAHTDLAQGRLSDPRCTRQRTQETRSQARPQGTDLHQALIH